MHLSLWYVVLVCHQYDVCENSVGSVYIGGYGGLSESRLSVLVSSWQLCPISFQGSKRWGERCSWTGEEHPGFQRLPPARGGTAQKKILHLANWSQLIHPGPASSMTKFFLCRVSHVCQHCLITHPSCYYLDIRNFEWFDNGPDHGKQQQQQQEHSADPFHSLDNLKSSLLQSLFMGVQELTVAGAKLWQSGPLSSRQIGFLVTDRWWSIV